jgi:hypothetical protein
LVAHFLNSSGEGFDLFLLLPRVHLQFLHLAMFFQELIQQHRVHRFVANCANLSVFITTYQIRVHLFYFLSYQTELWNSVRVDFLLVAKRYRLQRAGDKVRIRYYYGADYDIPISATDLK